jgi:hypothetical protein
LGGEEQRNSIVFDFDPLGTISLEGTEVKMKFVNMKGSFYKKFDEQIQPKNEL